MVADGSHERAPERVARHLVQAISPAPATSRNAAEEISPGTVKVHRRHAYAKLNVGSQSELFSLATRFLMAQSG